MGTSKSYPTPSGGPWSNAKRAITSYVSGGSSRPADVLSRICDATSGFREIGGTGAGGGGGGRTGFRASAARAAATVGGFGAAVASEGLDAALDALDLSELQGRPAVEVIARLADHIASSADGLNGPLIQSSFVDALFEAAEITGDMTYSDLEESLQTFLEDYGADGLAELFLVRMTVSQVLHLIEQHTDATAKTNEASSALYIAIEDICRQRISGSFEEARAEGRFDGLDWFGADGRKLSNRIVAEIADRLQSAGEE